MGGLFAIYEGIEKLRHPHELENIGIAIGILVFAILLETWSFRTALVETNRAPRPADDRGGTSGDRRRPSCRSCCSRTSARSSG